MKKTKSLLLLAGATSLVTLLNVDVAFAATDGAAQVSNFLTIIAKILIGLGGIVAVFYLILGGFHYKTSGGHPEKLKKAKDTCLYAFIGLVIDLAAFSMVDYIADIAKKSFGS